MFYITDKQTDEIIDFIPEKSVIEATHTQSITNYSESLEITAIADGSFAEHLGDRNRIISKTEDGEFREFRIENAYQYHDEYELPTVEIEAVGSYADLITAKHIKKHVSDAWTAKQHAESAVSGTEWRIDTVANSTFRTLHFDNHTNPFAYLKRVANELELELRFSIKVEGNRITDRYVDLVEQLGEYHGKRVEFGKDLQGVEREENDGEIVTALFGYGPEDEDGNRVSVFVEDKEALARWGRNGQHIVDYHEVDSEDTEMTEDEVEQYTRTELNKRINASVKYTVDFANLEVVPGLSHEAVRLGDTILIKDTSFNPALYLEARVFSVEVNPINKREKLVEVGDFTRFTGEQINSIWLQLQEEIRKKIDMSDLTEATYTKEEIDEKDIPGNEAKDKIDREVGDDVIETETGAQDKADNAEDNANRYTDEHAVAQELYDQTIADINENLSGKAELEYVNGQLQLKADSEIVQAIDNIVDDLQGVTDGLLTDVADHADELSDQGGRITTVETDLDTVEGNLSVAINDLSTLDGVVEEQGTQISANSEAISLKADQTTLEGLQDDFDNLQVGGRNMLVGSDLSQAIPRTSLTKLSLINEGVFNTARLEKESGVEGTFGITIYPRSSSFKSGETVTLSFELRGNISNLDYSYFMAHDSTNKSFQIDINGVSESEFKRFTLTTSMPLETTNQGYLLLASKDNSDELLWFELRKPKIEKGNKATDWTPAPEDIEADINAIDGKVETVSGNLSVLAGEVELKAERSALETVEGDVSTLSEEVGSLSVAYDGIEASVSSLETTVGDHTDNFTNLSATLGIMQGQINSKVSAEYVTGAIADIEVGGRNLLRNSTFNDDYDYWSLHSSYSTIVPPEEDKPNSNILHMHHENHDGNSPRPSETPFPKIKVGDVITFSLDIFAENISDISDTILTFRHATSPNGSHNGGIYNFNRSNLPNDFIEGEWNRVSGTFEIEDVTDGKYLYIALYTSRGYFNFKVREIQVEKGNKATDWTPSPEDTNAEIEFVYEYAESNISQLSGRIDAKAESTVVDDIEGRVSSAETSIDGLEGAITSKVEVTTFNTLEGRVDEAESTISQHANQIQSKVEENDVRSIFTQEADSFTFDADQINFDGHVFGENATFEGDIVGGRILSNTTIDVGTDLYVGNNIYLGDSSFEVKTIHFNDYASISNTGTTSDDITVTGNSLQFGYQSAYYGGIQLTIDGSYNSSPTINFDTNNNQYDSSIVLDRLSGDLQFHGDEFDFKGNVRSRQYYSDTGYFKFNDSNSMQITSSNIRLISGGELKQAFGSIPKVRLDPSGDGVVDDKTFGANNPASMQPVLTDYMIVNLSGETEIILNTDFLNFVSDYYVFADKNVEVLDQSEDRITVNGDGKHMIQVVGIQKGKEDVVGYRIVNEEEKVQTMGLLSTAPTENNPINRTFKPKIRGEEAKGNETRRK